MKERYARGSPPPAVSARLGAAAAPGPGGGKDGGGRRLLPRSRPRSGKRGGHPHQGPSFTKGQP